MVKSSVLDDMAPPCEPQLFKKNIVSPVKTTVEAYLGTSAGAQGGTRGCKSNPRAEKTYYFGKNIAPHRTLQVIGDKRKESKPEADLNQVLGALKELISYSARSLVGAVE